MRRFVALVACSLVAGCSGGDGGAAQPAAVRTAAESSRPAVEISLRGDDTRCVVFGHPLSLRGVVRPSGAAVTVRLLATSHPYPVSKPVQSTTTGEGGSFRFTVRP